MMLTEILSPRQSIKQSWWVVASFLACLVTSVTAGTIKVDLPTRSSWVGSPIPLNLIFENVSTHDQPQIPDTQGLRIQ
ncbi:MAG: hypothetical protein MK100_03530, partial [Phycisphaerales bacterium]|nr:hypothetical protein [Phycisphaerales bacterium]